MADLYSSTGQDERLSTLVEAVRAVSRGETWLSPRVAAKVARRAVESAPGEGTRVIVRCRIL